MTSSGRAATKSVVCHKLQNNQETNSARFPLKNQSDSLCCVWLKQNAAVFSSHRLPCIDRSFALLLHRRCVFHQTGNLLAEADGSMKSWIMLQMEQNIPRNAPTSQALLISYMNGVLEGGFFLLAEHNRHCVFSAERWTQRMKLEPEAETWTKKKLQLLQLPKTFKASKTSAAPEVSAASAHLETLVGPAAAVTLKTSWSFCSSSSSQQLLQLLQLLQI